MRNILRFLMLICCVFPFLILNAEEPGLAQNVVLITLDGLRGEEVFGGADQRLMIKENGVEKPDELKTQYWGEDRENPGRFSCHFFGISANKGEHGLQVTWKSKA